MFCKSGKWRIYMKLGRHSSAPTSPAITKYFKVTLQGLKQPFANVHLLFQNSLLHLGRMFWINFWESGFYYGSRILYSYSIEGKVSVAWKVSGKPFQKVAKDMILHRPWRYWRSRRSSVSSDTKIPQFTDVMGLKKNNLVENSHLGWNQ